MLVKPKLVFLSGGTAINALAKQLTHHPVDVSYLITTFDSGGSSATLREAFDMPALGDLRSRLVAIAGDDNDSQCIAAFLGRRFSKTTPHEVLQDDIEALLQKVKRPLASTTGDLEAEVLHYLACFTQHMPTDFSLQGASLGNLVMAGIYLEHNRSLLYAVDKFRQWLNIRATVLPISVANAHLTVALADGQLIQGQHAFTGKESSPIVSPIKQLGLVNIDDDSEVQALEAALAVLESADLICYPPGSFYSSVMANVLPKGIKAAIEQNDCVKVYVPNLGEDPEQFGLCIVEQIQYILSLSDMHFATLNRVLLDSTDSRYSLIASVQNPPLAPLLIQKPLGISACAKQYSPLHLANALVDLCAQP